MLKQLSQQRLLLSLYGVKCRYFNSAFIKEAGGADIRCLVGGDHAVAAMKRQGVKVSLGQIYTAVVQRYLLNLPQKKELPRC